MNGWIKLHRKITEWEWYTDRNTLAVFLHLLIMANIEDKKYRGYDVKRGECIIGRHRLAEDLNMSEQNVRTAINHLLLTNEITIKTTNQFTIVTICNYNSYQVVEMPTDQRSNQQPNQQSTNDQPTGNQQLTTPKEYIEYEEIKESKEERKKKADKSATRFQKPTIEEIKQYCQERGNGIDAEHFWHYYETRNWTVSGRKMKSWKSAVITWEKRNTPQPTAQYRQKDYTQPIPEHKDWDI